MRHAFLIIAHDQPALLERILRLLDAPNHYFCVMLDDKSNLKNELEQATSQVRNLLKITYLSINWGGYSQINAEIQLLRNAYSAELGIDYYHLISGADFPCCNTTDFDKVFEQNYGRSFLKYDPQQNEYANQKRVNRIYLNDYFDVRHGEWNLLRNRLERLINHVLHRKPLPMQLHKGANWFSLHHKVVEYILQFLSRNPWYAKRFKYTYCCDEIFLHTLLFPKLQELDIVTETNLRYIDWHPHRQYQGGLPLTLEAIDYDDIIASCSILCRKVTLPQSTKLLELLECHIKS